MININYKVLIVTILLLFSFFNNLLFGFENLKKINQHIDQECFLVNVNPQIEIDKPFIKQIKVIYKYVVFYLFFYNIEDPSSVISILNYC